MVGVNKDTLWIWLGEQDRGRRIRSRRLGRKSSQSSLRPEGSKGGDDERKEGGGNEKGENVEEEEEVRQGEEKRDEEEEAEERKMRESFLGRVTHLHLQNKGITHVEDMRVCGGALVAYLQHNRLTRIANLRPLQQLQELYLQDNEITRLEGLRGLSSLRRLLVSGNRVGVVEGLPRGLTELHVQDQRLPPGDALILDPHALAAVQDTLRVLDVSGNRLTEIGAVGLLSHLQVLQAAHNDLCSLSHLGTVLGRLPHLRLLTLTGNPVTAHRRYRPAAILAAAHSLEMLDDKQVTPQCREFLVQADRYRAATRRETNPRRPGFTGPPSNSTAQEATPTKPEPHILFTPVMSDDHPHDSPATGPRFVLGALRRPEFDLILRRAERQRGRLRRPSKAPQDPETSDWPGVGLIEHHDSSGDDLTDTDFQDGGTRGGHWSQESSGPPKSVWFAEDEDLSPEELPRLVPRPYWRNKPPAPRGTASVPVAT